MTLLGGIARVAENVLYLFLGHIVLGNMLNIAVRIVNQIPPDALDMSHRSALC
jgi:hypothetical protein